MSSLLVIMAGVLGGVPAVLLALIEVDRSVFTIDTPTLKKLKEAGVSETVIVALIRSGRPAPKGSWPGQRWWRSATPLPGISR